MVRAEAWLMRELLWGEYPQTVDQAGSWHGWWQCQVSPPRTPRPPEQDLGVPRDVIRADQAEYQAYFGLPPSGVLAVPPSFDPEQILRGGGSLEAMAPGERGRAMLAVGEALAIRSPERARRSCWLRRSARCGTPGMTSAPARPPYWWSWPRPARVTSSQLPLCHSSRNGSPVNRSHQVFPQPGKGGWPRRGAFVRASRRPLTSPTPHPSSSGPPRRHESSGSRWRLSPAPLPGRGHRRDSATSGSAGLLPAARSRLRRWSPTSLSSSMASRRITVRQ